MTVTGSGRRNRRKLPPEPSRAPFDGLRAEGNLDYLFATDGSLNYSRSTAMPDGPGVAARAAVTFRGPGRKLLPAVLGSGIKMRWGVVIGA
jgi:hypothetical protein